MSNEVIEMESGQRAVAVAPANAVTPADLLRHALDSGADLDRLEKLMDLQDRWEANEARKAFADAMADFKLDPPKVFKDKHVSFKTSTGKTEYDHATLGNANDIIIAALARHGFSHRWITSQRDGKVIVDCVLTHRKGHSQTNTLESAPDQSGGKNSIQAIISARSYLERHTLFDATGLAAKDAEDDDGRGAGSFGTTDTNLADEWIAKVKAAATDEDVCAVWASGIKAIEAAKDKHAYAEFKTAVEDRRAALVGAEQ